MAGAKGSKKCCCTPCQTKIGCTSGGELLNHCCECVPTRICVRLYDDDDPYTVLAYTEVTFSCNETGQYAGSLQCEDDLIDFLIEFSKDEYTGECDICLESEYLDMTGANRACLPMGGESNDAQVKRAECAAMAFTFPVDLTNVTCTTATSGTISIEAGPYITFPPKPRCGPGSVPETCLCDIACITYTDVDEYGNEISEKATVCSGEEYDGTVYWDADFDLGPSIRIEVEQENPLKFRLMVNSGLPDPASAVLDVCCYSEDDNLPVGCRMAAEWDDFGSDSAASIRIAGDGSNTCNECKCLCQTVCATLVTPDLSTTIEMDYDSYTDSWHGTIGGHEIELTLVCDGCLDPATKMQLTLGEGDACTILSANPTGIACPNMAGGVTYTLDCGDYTEILYLSCKTCEADCLTSQETECCYGTQINNNLTATIEDTNASCANLNGVEIPLVFRPGTTSWTGELTVDVGGSPCTISVLTFTCEGGNVWRLDGGINGGTATAISCDPLEVLFDRSGMTSGCCTTPVSGDLSVRVTE